MSIARDAYPTLSVGFVLIVTSVAVPGCLRHNTSELNSSIDDHTLVQRLRRLFPSGTDEANARAVRIEQIARMGGYTAERFARDNGGNPMSIPLLPAPFYMEMTGRFADRNASVYFTDGMVSKLTVDVPIEGSRDSYVIDVPLTATP